MDARFRMEKCQSWGHVGGKEDHRMHGCVEFDESRDGTAEDWNAIIFDLPVANGVVREVRRRIMDAARRLPFSESELDSIETSVGEAALNAVRHGSPQGLNDFLRVCCRRDKGRLIVEITDRGKGFVPSNVPLPVAENMKSDGYGLCLMQGLMDEIEYLRAPQGGTTVRLMKRYADVD